MPPGCLFLFGFFQVGREKTVLQKLPADQRFDGGLLAGLCIQPGENVGIGGQIEFELHLTCVLRVIAGFRLIELIHW